MTHTVVTEFIFHLAEPSDWARAVASGAYAADSLATEGFIHASTAAQVPLTFARYYADRTDLVLLAVDPAGLDVRWETSGEDLFPHVYEPIATAYVELLGPYAGGDVQRGGATYS